MGGADLVLDPALQPELFGFDAVGEPGDLGPTRAAPLSAVQGAEQGDADRRRRPRRDPRRDRGEEADFEGRVRRDRKTRDRVLEERMGRPARGVGIHEERLAEIFGADRDPFFPPARILE